jgi:hypothetical protein
LGLLLKLPKILGHQDFQVQGTLEVDMPLNREACIIIGQVPQFFSRIDGPIFSNLLNGGRLGAIDMTFDEEELEECYIEILD